MTQVCNMGARLPCRIQNLSYVLCEIGFLSLVTTVPDDAVKGKEVRGARTSNTNYSLSLVQKTV